jgi:protein-L-isoaspartate(D-aspartate) O-methyltransferase
MVALMCEVARLTGVERVLEVGTGSGYAAAVLARLAADIYSLECLPALYERARARFEVLEIGNVHLSCRDGSEGWPEQAPFDVIVVTAAMTGIERPLLEQLKPDGRGLRRRSVMKTLAWCANSRLTRRGPRILATPGSE